MARVCSQTSHTMLSCLNNNALRQQKHICVATEHSSVLARLLEDHQQRCVHTKTHHKWHTTLPARLATFITAPAAAPTVAATAAAAAAVAALPALAAAAAPASSAAAAAAWCLLLLGAPACLLLALPRPPRSLSLLRLLPLTAGCWQQDRGPPHWQPGGVG